MAPSKAYPINTNGASSPSDKSMADANSVGNDVNDDGSIAVGFLRAGSLLCSAMYSAAARQKIKIP